jgi:CRP-like cAMP-binding protein
MNQELLKELSKIGVEKTLRSHTTITQFGDRINKLYLIKSGGLVLLHVHPKTGAERAINFFIPTFHPLATIAESFYLGTPSNYHLKTFTNTTLIEIKKSDFDEFVKTSAYGEMMMEYGIKSLLEKNELRAKLISYTSEEMLLYLHKEFPKVIQNVPSKYIANFLGITPQWLSKLKHKL